MKHFTICSCGLLFMLCLSKSSILQAQERTFDIDLLTNTISNPDSLPVHNAYNTDYTPSIRVFLPEKKSSTGRAIIICPGGGYAMLAIGHEGYKWADYFKTQGIAVIVLKYRLPKGNYKTPISDAEIAFKIVRDSAANWKINPNNLGIMGFSAGGHLASTIATHTKPPMSPKFQILFYPVITMDPNYTHMGSHNNLLGKNASASDEMYFSNEKQVSDTTPPAFIALACDDKVVPPSNGINYFMALNKHHVQASLHVYPTGNHGWGYRESYKFQKEILSELSLWLKCIE